MQKVRPALRTEAQTLSDLAIRSKAHWGYRTEELEVFRDELTLSASDCVEGLVRVVERDSKILGFYKIIDDYPAGELDCLFVDPEYIGTGLGKLLFNRAISHATALGINDLMIVSDPNAVGFYEYMGAELVDYQRRQSIAERSLPVLHIEIAEVLENV